MIFPNVACLLQEKLGIRGSPGVQHRGRVLGIPVRLVVADQFMRSGQAKRALVIGAETMSRIIDWTDRETCVLFGDGAGAVILEASDEPGIIYYDVRRRRRLRELLYASSGVATRHREACEAPLLRMKGNEVFKVAVKTLENLVDEVLEKNKLEKGQIDWLIPHQANMRIIEATAKRLEMPMERVILTVASTATRRRRRCRWRSTRRCATAASSAATLLLEAFGGGFTWGASLIRY